MSALVLVCGPGVAQGGSDSRPAFNPNSRFKIEWATFIGGAAYDRITRVVVAPDGSIWVCGQAGSPGLPVSADAIKSVYSEPLRKRNKTGGSDGYLAHFGSDGRLLAGSYFGGSKDDEATGLGLDHDGDVVLFGASMSPDLPVSEGVIQTRHAEAASEGWNADQDWFVAKLAPDLRRVVWCTYLGGPGCEEPGRDVLTDADNNVIVAGEVHRSFPHVLGDSRPVETDDPSDACVAKIKANGTGFISCCRFGGQGQDHPSCLGVRQDGSIVVAGFSGANVDGTGSPDYRFPGCIRVGADRWTGTFAAILRPDGAEVASLLYVNGDAHPWGGAVVADGSVVLAGITNPMDGFPFTPAAYEGAPLGEFDGCLIRIAADGKSMPVATILGGISNDGLRAAAIASSGDVWVAGSTSSEGMKLTGDALHFYRGGGSDGLLGCFSADGARLRFATFLGGANTDSILDLAIAPDGAIYLVGLTTSPDFPVTSGAVQKTIGGSTDGFVLKLRENPRPIEGR